MSGASTALLGVTTFVLGLFAGDYRERFGILAPTLGIHVTCNVGGLLGGIVGLLRQELEH